MNLRYIVINDMLADLFILKDICEGSVAAMERPGTPLANNNIDKWLKICVVVTATLPFLLPIKNQFPFCGNICSEFLSAL